MAEYISVLEVYNRARSISNEIANKQYAVADYYARQLYNSLASATDYLETKTASIVREIEDALERGGLASDENINRIINQLSGLNNILNNQLTNLDNTLDDMATRIEAELERSRDQIASAIGTIGEEIAEVFKPLIEAIQAANTSIMEQFKIMVSVLSESILESNINIQTLISSLNTDMMLLFTTIVNSYEQLHIDTVEYIETAIRETGEQIQDNQILVQESLTFVINETYGVLSKYIETSDDRIETLITELIKYHKEVVTRLDNLLNISVEDILTGINLIRDTNNVLSGQS